MIIESEKGFGLAWLILAIIGLSTIAVSGAYIYIANNNTDGETVSNEATSSQQSETEENIDTANANQPEEIQLEEGVNQDLKPGSNTEDYESRTFTRYREYGDEKYMLAKLVVDEIIFDDSEIYAGGNADSETYTNYLTLRATLANEGTDRYRFHAFDFELETDESIVIQRGFIVVDGKQLDESVNWQFSEVAPGNEISVQLLFPLENAESASTITWTPLEYDNDLQPRYPFRDNPVRFPVEYR